MVPKFVILMLSGGLDSVVLLYHLIAEGCKVHCLLFDYKQRHVQELAFAKQHCRRLNVMYSTIELPHLGGLTDTDWVIPNRNAIFLSIGVNLALQAGAESVVIGCNSDDSEQFPDCRKEFLDSINAAVKAAGYSVEICAPFLDWPKWKILGLAQEMGVPLHEIWTCYRGGKDPCGTCPACLKLAAAKEHK